MMSRKVGKPREISTDASVAKDALDRRKMIESQEESVAERVRKNIEEHGA
jgi:hypothetical protein